MVSHLNGSAKSLYIQAKEKSNNGQYEESSDLFSQAASGFEKTGQNIWAAKAYACASWDRIHLGQFDMVQTYLDRATELDNCRGIEALLHTLNYCLYYEKLEREKGNDVAAEKYLQHSREYLVSAISLIYEWGNFASYKLKNHIEKLTLGLVNYLIYVIDEFFIIKEKEEKRINPHWVASNKARRVKTRETFGQDRLSLGETLEKANLRRFSQTLLSIDLLSRAQIEQDIQKVADVSGEAVKILPRELSSLPSVVDLKIGLEKLRSGEECDIKVFLTKAINSINDINHYAANELSRGILSDEVKNKILTILKNKVRRVRIRNPIMNTLLTALVFIFSMFAIPAESWPRIGFAFTISGFFMYYIDKLFPLVFKID